MKRTYIWLFVALLCPFLSKAQAGKDTSATDSLMKHMSAIDGKTPVIAPFKATRVIFSQTTQTNKKHNLNFLVIHRFGDIGGVGGGGQTLWGFDDASDIYIGFEYGLTDKLDINFGRSKFEQLIQLGFKYNIAEQTADNNIPVALALVADAGLKPYKETTGRFNDYNNQFAYFFQLVIARKISSAVSLQVSPGYLRDNSPFPFLPGNGQNIFSVAVAGRVRVTRHMSVVADYTHPFSPFRQHSVAPEFFDPSAIGIEIETGGHVFTINLSNAQAISPINYLSDSQSNWLKGQFRLGFTISRIFDLNHNHKGTYK